MWADDNKTQGYIAPTVRTAHSFFLPQTDHFCTIEKTFQVSEKVLKDNNSEKYEFIIAEASETFTWFTL